MLGSCLVLPIIASDREAKLLIDAGHALGLAFELGD